MSQRCTASTPSRTAASVALRFAAALATVLLGGSSAAFVTPPVPPPTVAPHVGGQWGPVIAWPHIPVAMANLPDGRILAFSSNERNAYPFTGIEFTHATVWDPATGVVRSVPHPSHDLFCAAVVTLESGETFVMGGHNEGFSPWVSYYDFHRDRWMQLGIDQDLNRGRWYPTAVYMGSGNVFIAGGAGGGNYPEVWTPGEGWKLLTGIDLSSTITSIGTIDGAGNWPLLQLDPNGTIFHHGATPTMNRLDPLGGIGGLGTITDLGPHDFGWFPGQGLSVFYDVGKILVAGGSLSTSNSTAVTSARRIDINGPAPVISETAPMHYPRVFMNEVVLPTGDIFVVGGNTTGFYFSDWNAVKNPEVWDPDTGTWTLLNPQDQARTYHSTAILLLDGTVVSGGGGMLGQPCEGLGSPGECGIDHWNIEVYSPPYLFDADDSPATRPVIGDAPRVARVGRTITVHATPGLSGFSMVRMSGATHTMNTDQRFVRPESVETSPGIYALTLHPNQNVLVPGYWMLFALDGEVPSIAKAVQIVNDGTPRGPPIEGRHDEVGDDVLFQVEVEDPDGHPITFSSTGLPDGLSLSGTNGVIEGATTTPGLYNVSIVAFDGTDAVDIDFQWVVSTELSEAGTLTSNPNAWTTVQLQHDYDQPVVVMGPPSAGDAAPALVRVRNVTSSSFEFLVAKWPYQGGVHGSETLSYLVVEAGEYTIPGGGSFVAGVSTGIDSLHPKPEAFSAGAFTETPVVLTQIATTNAGPASQPAATRVENVSATGFTVRIQEQEQGDQRLPAEDVHWIAVEPMTVSGLLEAAISPAPVDETPLSTDYAQAFSALPRLFANLQTIEELDPVTLRHQAASTAGFELFAQEEQSADAEVDHAPEIFGWLALDPSATTLGLLPLFNEPPSIVTPANQIHYRGSAVSLFVQAADPEGGALTFSATGLPPGLHVDPGTGEVFGTIAGSGSFVVSVTVSDASGDADVAVFLWTVNEPLEIVAFPTPPILDGDSADYDATTNVAGSFEYEWDFGDGSPPAGPGASPSIQHVFTEPGRYVVTLTVRDPASSQVDVRQFVQIVASPPTGSAPTASSSIVYAPSNHRVWAVNPDNASVAVIDALTMVRIAEIPVAAGPRTLAVAGDGRIWVACREASAVQILDPTTLGVVQTIDLQDGSSPYGIVFDPVGTTAFVALEDAGKILRLDGLTGALLTAQAVGRNVRHLSVTADGLTLHATRFVTPPLPGEGLGVPQTESGGNPVGGEVLNLDAATLAPGPTTILRVHLSSDTEQNARGVPNYLGAPVISPDGTHLLVPSKQDNVLRGGFRDGLGLGHDSTVRAISSRVDLATGLEDVDARIDHDDASVASATLFSALGAYAFTTLEGNRQLAVFDPFSHVELGRVDTGMAPHGIARSPDGTRLFVDNFMGRSVSVFDLSRLMEFNEVDLPLAATIPKIAVETLPANVLLGKQLFNDAADPRLARQGYVFCGACHADGGQDGRTWDFTHIGQGLRNTIDLTGHGVGQGPLHWVGNFDEVQDFEVQIRGFGGLGLLTDAQFQANQAALGPPKAGLSVELDALAAFVASLTTTGASPARANDGSFTPEALAGRALFKSKGCGGCHRGSQFSDSAPGIVHDVGTLKVSSGPQTGIDTPTLRGLWHSAPYLHDGSAANLEQAIAAHHSISMTTGERTALAAYLEQIDDAETTAPNATPTVLVTSPADGASADAGTPIALTATATDPEQGDLTASIVWTSNRDGVLGTGGNLLVGTLSVGSHVLTASATDGGQSTGEDQVDLTIVGNVGPTVTITSPADASTYTETRPVLFAATATDPEDGDTSANIVWTSSLTGPLGTGPTLSLTTLVPGVHILTALVVDTGGLPDSESVQVTIAVNAPPIVAITSPANGSTRSFETPVHLAATASDPEDGVLGASIAWTSSLDGALGAGASLDTSTLSLGTHTLTASVTDGLGLSRSAQITLTIAVNAPPSVTISAPQDGATATEHALVTLSATATDTEDGDLTASIAWTSSRDGALGAGGTLAIGNLSVGTHTLTAAAVDQRGLAGEAHVSLTIAADAAPVVTIHSPADGSTTTEGENVVLSATASDEEDGDLSSEIVWSSNLAGPLGAGASLGLSSLAIGTHVLTAAVTDHVGVPSSAQVSLAIVANAAPQLSILSPAPNTTITEGATVVLSATAFDPEDGDLSAQIVWVSSVQGALGTGPSLVHDDLRIGVHYLTAMVVDHLGNLETVPLRLTVVPNRPPIVTVTSPQGFVEISETDSLELAATALDPEDGDLGANVLWSSDQDGALGSGSQLTIAELSVGLHTITVSVSDSRGAPGSAQTSVSVPEPDSWATLFAGTGLLAALARRRRSVGR